ncbi:MAG: SUMF1/EgtB/PvdO family nonheme iron enzyme [Polyangiaceae bacterium]|nr:SUMF1/EgtB/PvdO family nonheme iron enzyme [Polyangiaceae bacterium]
MSWRRWWFGAFAVAIGCGGAGAPPPPTPAPAGDRTPKPPAPAAAPEAETPARAEPSGCPEGMALLSAGTLWLGSPQGQGRADERPQQRTDVGEFCLDLREVTVGDFAGCVANKACDVLPREVLDEGAAVEPAPPPAAASAAPAASAGAKPPAPAKGGAGPGRPAKAPAPAAEDPRNALCSANAKAPDTLPLSCVSFEEATKYCSWKGLRLPTEPELEYAATSGEDKLAYPWGSTAPDAALACFGKKDGPCAAGSKPAGAFGLFDIVGNLLEWTTTPYAPYDRPSAEAPRHAVRGGSWQSTDLDELRGKRRFSRHPMSRAADLGFRCAKSR